jgi:hypothetical protein
MILMEFLVLLFIQIRKEETLTMSGNLKIKVLLTKLLSVLVSLAQEVMKNHMHNLEELTQIKSLVEWMDFRRCKLWHIDQNILRVLNNGLSKDNHLLMQERNANRSVKRKNSQLLSIQEVQQSVSQKKYLDS